MFKKLFNRANRKNKDNEKSEEQKLIDKVNDSQNRVIDSFASFGINNGPVSITITNQDILKPLIALEKYYLDATYKSDDYISGIYVLSNDLIFLDKQTVEDSIPLKLAQILSHEYAHRLFSKFNIALRKRNKTFDMKGVSRIALPGTTIKEINTIEEFENYLKSLPKIKRTKKDKLRLEFDIYFEEMFAESVALYLTEQIDREDKLKNYSDSQKGELLCKDKQFINKLESALYQSFFERLFDLGLKKVTMMSIPLYNYLGHQLEKRYKEKLPA